MKNIIIGVLVVAVIGLILVVLVLNYNNQPCGLRGCKDGFHYYVDDARILMGNINNPMSVRLDTVCVDTLMLEIKIRTFKSQAWYCDRWFSDKVLGRGRCETVTRSDTTITVLIGG